MQQTYYPARNDANGSGIQFLGVWNVDADDTYDVHCSHRTHSIVIRTLAGEGFVTLGNNRKTRLDVGTLWLMDGRRLTHYGTEGARWFFRWFMFQSAGTLPVPPETIIRCPDDFRDEDDFSELTKALGRQNRANGVYAASLFSMILARWMASWQGAARRHPRQDDIERVVQRLYESPEKNWTVDEMAEVASLGVRRFRDVFEDITGRPPKKYYDDLRLSLALELLRQGALTVSETAARTGFSCPFHFSKMFKKQFGLSPTHARNGEMTS